MKVKIITDSACDLPIKYINDNNIEVLRLSFTLNGKSMKDNLGETLEYSEFYNMVRNGEMPTTSQVNSYEFEEVFNKYIDEGFEIIYIGLASALSGTFNSANIAKMNILEEKPNAKLTIIDSLSVSLGLGLLVCKASEMLREGHSAEEIINWVENNKKKVVHCILIDDLKHLKRGGRISGATAAVGSLLNIKPILSIDDSGKLVPTEKVKGKKRALKYLMNEVKEKAINPENENLFICHGDCLDDAETLKDMILQEVKFKNVMVNYIGSVVGSHGGPGVIAAVFLAEKR
jgi:DegV family protein with EDD domain